MFLKVREIVESHNHETSEAIFRSLPHQRLNFDKPVKEKYAKILAQGANKRKILKEISTETNRSLTLRDLSNFCAKPYPQTIEKCIEELTTIYWFEVYFKVDGNNILGLYFQDKTMKEYIKAFPEIIFIDGIAFQIARQVHT